MGIVSNLLQESSADRRWEVRPLFTAGRAIDEDDCSWNPLAQAGLALRIFIAVGVEVAALAFPSHDQVSTNQRCTSAADYHEATKWTVSGSFKTPFSSRPTAI